MQKPTFSQKWPYVLLSVGNLIGLLASIGLAGLVAISSLINFLRPTADSAGAPADSFLFASGIGLCCLFFVPASLYALQRANGTPVRAVQVQSLKVWQVALAALVWVGAVLASGFLYNTYNLGWLAAAPFFLAAVGLPVAVLVWIGLGGLEPGSRNRLWSSLTFSMTVSTSLATLLEIGLGLFLFIIAVAVLVIRPDWMSTLEHIVMQFSNTTDLDHGLQILSPYLMSPVTIVLLLLVLAVLIPLIEEAAKPLMVWILGRKLQTPAEGFAMGVVCGAGFALVEGLISASSPDQSWSALLAARAGGSLMHITATGLMGWAIASAWQGKGVRLLWTYPLSIALHGLWNSGAVFMALGNLQPALRQPAQASLAHAFSLAALGMITLVVAACLAILVVANRRLRNALAAQSDIIVPPAP